MVIRALVAELHENGFHQALDGVLGGAVGRLKSISRKKGLVRPFRKLAAGTDLNLTLIRVRTK